jgi:hypothetical protein
MSNQASVPPALRQPLDDTRRALLIVHKALLKAERVEYEGEHGRVEGNGEFMQLVIHQPRFAWLRPLLALVVHIDELLSADGLPTPDDVTDVVAKAREFLRPDEHGDLFHQRYHELMQEVPAVVIAHGEALQLLRHATTA